MTTNKKQTNIPAGVIFTILALMRLVNLSRLGEIAKEKPMFMLIALISLAAYGVLAAAFYTGNRTNLPLIGFGLLAAPACWYGATASQSMPSCPDWQILFPGWAFWA